MTVTLGILSIPQARTSSRQLVSLMRTGLAVMAVVLQRARWSSVRGRCCARGLCGLARTLGVLFGSRARVCAASRGAASEKDAARIRWEVDAIRVTCAARRAKFIAIEQIAAEREASKSNFLSLSPSFRSFPSLPASVVRRLIALTARHGESYDVGALAFAHQK